MLTSRNRLPIFFHEWIPDLQQIVLQCIQAPQRLLIQLLAFVGAIRGIQELLPRRCPTLLCIINDHSLERGKWTYQDKRTIIHELIKPTLWPVILHRQPRLHKRRTIIALDEMVLEPHERCKAPVNTPALILPVKKTQDAPSSNPSLSTHPPSGYLIFMCS